jgi:ATP-dependent Clp protease ATP-binding subunit ClpC
MFRLAVQLFFITGIAFIGLAASVVIALGTRYGQWWDHSVWIAIRPAAVLWFFIPTDTFLLGLLYFKMRDALCGATWARKSLSKVVLYDLLIALVALGSGIGFVALTDTASTFYMRS